MTMALECRGVTVAYDAQPVLRSLDLAVGPEEVVAVLGPSGSGKTTLLYAVAGFVDLTAGEILIGDRKVAAADHQDPPEVRDVGFVFQHYALWPHLDALTTVAYPLRRRGLNVVEASGRARDLLGRMGIADLAHRKPAALSGGQQQRVGLARALAARPALYLFDEPTAHIDTALRVTLLEELAEQRRVSGSAAVYATHDSAEALAIAGRIALVRDGAVVQVGSPEDVYARPVDLWAAHLTGPASVLHIDVAQAGRRQIIIRCEGRIVKVEGAAPAPGWSSVLVRPDWAELGGDLPGRVTHIWYRGPYTDYRLETAAGRVEIRRDGPPIAQTGQRINWTLHRVWSVPDVVSGSARA